jgi:hypothetical protein
MHELLRGASGERLQYDAYSASFDDDYEQLGEPEFWKLERRQVFQDTTMPSWQAFSRGDWDEAMRLAEALRPEIEEEYRQDAERGTRSWWIKIVEFPLTPYVQWAFQPLRIRAQSGEQMRMVRADQVGKFEKNERLPELVTFGASVMYELIYDEIGNHKGGVRISDRDVVTRCQRFIADLYSLGEDFESFYQREVVNLEPPRK